MVALPAPPPPPPPDVSVLLVSSAKATTGMGLAQRPGMLSVAVNAQAVTGPKAPAPAIKEPTRKRGSRGMESSDRGYDTFGTVQGTVRRCQRSEEHTSELQSHLN